jgi:spore maturation protein CgeB
MASGALFIAHDVPGVRRYFTPGVHFISYQNIEEAIEKTLFYLNNEEARMNIARQGKARADALINSRSFWVQIDSCLSKHGLY